MITEAHYVQNGSITATIDEVVYSNITQASRFWPELMAWQAEGNTITPWVPPPPPVPQEISDRQFFQQLAIMGMITEDEALAAVSTGTLPASFETIINTLPEEQRFTAKMLVQGATIFNRQNQFVAYFAYATGMTSEQVDDLWRQASEL